MHHAGRNGEHSCMENFHGDDIYPYNINKHSCTYQSLPEHKSPNYVNTSKGGTSSHTGTWKALMHSAAMLTTTLNLGSSVKEVDWAGNIYRNYTSSRSMHMEVDWGCNLNLIHTLCGGMLMEVDWGGKLILNSMIDWGTHGTHPNGHNISEVDWEAVVPVPTI